MKRIPQSFFLALFVFAISGFAQTHPEQTVLEEFWKEFSSTAGRFKVTLPGNPTKASTTIDSSLGKIKRHTFTSSAGFGTFLVSYSDLPVILAEPEQVKEFLDHMHEGEVESSQGKLLSMTEIELDGYPGREFIVETPKSTFRMRYYLVGRRFYHIAASTLTAGILAADLRKHADDLEKQGKNDLAEIFRENFRANSAAEMARSMIEITDEFFASFKLTGKPAVSSFAQTQRRPPAPDELWKEFSSTAGRFKVALPGNPTETSKTVEYRFRKFKRHMFNLEAGFGAFLVSYSDLPVILAEPDEVDEFLDHHMHEGEVASSQGKLLSKTEIDLDGYPGRELIVETPDSTFRMKYYLVEQRFYQIAISTPNGPAKNAEGTARSMVEITDEFFASFKLTGKPVNKAPAVDEKGKEMAVKKGVISGSALKKVVAAYPEEAQAAGVSGNVQVQVTISEEGRVIEAIAISGPELLREAAVQAAKEWVFKPTKLAGAPVKVRGILTFNFELK